VVFVRSKFGLKKWMPLNVLTGGAQANLLAKGLESELTKETSMATPTVNMASGKRAKNPSGMNTIPARFARSR
jgi:hypothetical protein